MCRSAREPCRSQGESTRGYKHGAEAKTHHHVAVDILDDKVAVSKIGAARVEVSSKSERWTEREVRRREKEESRARRD
jgi:hypothetical protein